MLTDEDKGLFEFDLLALLVVDEVGGNIPPVELHPLHKLNLVLQGLTLPDSDNSTLAHLLDQLCQQLADLLIPVGRNSPNVLNLAAILHLNRDLTQLGNEGLNCKVDSFFHLSEVHANLYLFESLLENGSSKDSRSSGAISCLIISLISDRLDQTGSHVGKPVRKLDSFRYSDTVLGDFDWAKALVD